MGEKNGEKKNNPFSPKKLAAKPSKMSEKNSMRRKTHPTILVLEHEFNPVVNNFKTPAENCKVYHQRKRIHT